MTRIVRPATPTPADVAERPTTTDPLPEAPTIRHELRNGGHLLTCPAGHTFSYKVHPAAEVIAPWIVAHEEHA